MFQAVIITNPLDPQKDLKRSMEPSGVTIREFLVSKYGNDFVYFDVPTLLQINGTPVLTEYNPDFPNAPTWATTIQPGDVFTIVPIPQGFVGVVIALIVLVVAALALVLALPDPANPGDASQGDSVYNLKGQTNQTRLGDAVECHYGQIRIWPSYAAPSFNKYEGNNQYQVSLYCLGLGQYEVSDIYIEDTPVDNFDEVTYEIIEPGGSPTLYPDSVTNSVEVAGLELYGSGHPDYVADGWEGGFVVNAAGSTITRVEVDVVFPQGLYSLNKKGGRGSFSVNVEFEAREVDDLGDPVGVWLEVATETITRATQTPQRMTFGADLPARRYEVRGRRTTAYNGSSRVAETATWEALRGFAPSSAVYPHTTMLAVKALASNNLNSNSRARVNVYATRKVEVYNPELLSWSLLATRNPIWAFCDVFRATYGGRLPNEYLDMTALSALATEYDEREDYFDGTFDANSSTVWEAARSIARVGRATPVPQGSIISAIRDRPQTLPAGLFNAENMVDGSFSEDLEIFEFGAYDSLLVEYTDPTTWKPVEMLCQLPGEFADNPESLKLFGITSRAQAYREGMYILATRRFRKTTFNFRTGLEGHVPTYLDMIGIHFDTFSAPMSGMVLAYDEVDKLMTLSEKVSFAPGYSHAILFRGSDGSAMGAAVECIAAPFVGTDPKNQIVLAEDPPAALNFNANEMPTLFFFGIVDCHVVKALMTRIAPVDEDTLEISATTYDPRVYEFDDSPVPALVVSNTPKDSDLPDVQYVTIATLPDKADLSIISWGTAPGADSYLLQRTFDLPVDGLSNWENVATTTSEQTTYETTSLPGEVVYRVYAIKGGLRGVVRYSPQTIVGTEPVPNPPTVNPYTPVDTLSFIVTWQASPDSLGYTIKVNKTGDPTLLREVDVFNADGLSFEYTNAEMIVDLAGQARSFDLKIFAFGSGGDSVTSTDLTVSNPAPPVLTSPATTPTGGTNYDFTWDALSPLPADFDFYRVYGSATPGFTPGASNQLYQGTAATVNLSRPATTYWRVAAFDKWASGHTDANFTAEQTLTV